MKDARKQRLLLATIARRRQLYFLALTVRRKVKTDETIPRHRANEYSFSDVIAKTPLRNARSHVESEQT
jgi:hypothetical protein